MIMATRFSGVELSDIAVRSFVVENGLSAECMEGDRFVSVEADGIRLLQGDIFQLQAVDLEGVKAVWDRAALVAFPEPMRQRYSRQMGQLLSPGTSVLLVTMDYPQAEMAGPPFSVTAGEVERLFSPVFEMELLAAQDVLQGNQRLREKGITRIEEQIWQLRRR